MTAVAKSLLVAVVVIACLLVVVLGQRTVGWTALAAMMAAMGVLLFLVSRYNRRFR